MGNPVVSQHEDTLDRFGLFAFDLFELSKSHLQAVGSQVIKEDGLCTVGGSMAKGVVQGSSSILVDQTEDIEISQTCSIDQELSLLEIPVAGDSEDDIFDGPFDVFFGFVLDVPEHHGHCLEETG